MGISVEFDDKELQDALSGLLAMGQNLNPVLGAIGDSIVETTAERFSTGLAPDGSPWKISRRAAADGGETLVDSGDLKKSFLHEVSGNEVVIGPSGPANVYAAIHQFGGVIRAKNGGKLAFKTPLGFALLDQVTIPARPYLGVSADDEIEVANIVQDHYREAVNGR